MRSNFFGLPNAAILISLALYRFVIGLLVGIDGGSGAVGALLLMPFAASIVIIARAVPTALRKHAAREPISA